MAAIMLQSILGFDSKFSKKCLFISANTSEKNLVCKDYCVAYHDDKTCFLPACIYHIILPGNVKELLKKLDTFCFTYQHVDCLHTLLKYRFSGKVMQRVDKFFITCNKQLTLITKTREWTECRALQKKRLLRKSSKSIYSAPFKRQKQRRPVDQCLQTELNKLKRLHLNWN